ADLTGQNLRTGIATLDDMLTGAISASLDASRAPEGISLRTLRLDGPRVSVTADGSTPGAPIDVNARLSDLALLAPGFDGPAQATGSLVLRDDMGRDIGVDLQASGPAGTTATVTGDIRDLGQSLELALTGAAPLELANRFIAPRSVEGRSEFDLRVSGAPALGSVSGRVTLADGRVALPTLSAAFANLQGGIDLRNGSAEISITADGRESGSLAVNGPIDLQPPYSANLTVLLNALGHSDPDLYKTKVSGVVSMTGPLAGGAQIGGQLQLGDTEIRVPSSNLANVGLLPQIRHVDEPPAVTETRRRAGLIQQAEPDAAGPAYGLDLTILAPNRIFVRGRGLDAELGGRLRVTGTTNDVVPSGMFELIRGRLDILGKRLTLTEGRVDLRGAFDPYLRFVAESDADDVTLRVVVEGLASEPDIRFTSSPDLPQEEVVARLIFGRGLDSISPFQAAQLAAAVATLAGRLDDGLLGGLRESVGLSNLDVTTSDTGATQLSAGAYISENIYSEISADSSGEQQIDLNIDLSRNVTVKGRLNSEGNTGIGIYFEKDY
ncbi:MAG: translocation/assembly module TamB domain-containing protein, partial [Roseovarius gahaiensis]